MGNIATTTKKLHDVDDYNEKKNTVEILLRSINVQKNRVLLPRTVNEY